MIKAELRKQMKEAGLLFMKEVREIYGVDGKTINRATAHGQMKYVSLPGYRFKLYKKEYVEEFLDKKDVRFRSVSYESICNYCEEDFVFVRKELVSWFGKSRREKTKSDKRAKRLRKWCDNCLKCAKGKENLTEVTRKKLSEGMKKWWSNVSQEQKSLMRSKQSVMKKKYWDNNKGQKDIMSKNMKKSLEEFWKADKRKEEFSNTVKVGMLNAWKEIREQNKGEIE